LNVAQLGDSFLLTTAITYANDGEKSPKQLKSCFGVLFFEPEPEDTLLPMHYAGAR